MFLYVYTVQTNIITLLVKSLKIIRYGLAKHRNNVIDGK